MIAPTSPSTPPTPTRYRKKPVEVDALLFDGTNGTAVAHWCGGRLFLQEKPSDPTDVFQAVEITTLEGTMRANAGDYVIRGVQGEFYPCKPDIFEATYEPASREEWPLGQVAWKDAAHGATLAGALLSAVEAIKTTGGAVEIAGVRIEPCDSNGTTATARSRDDLAEALAAVRALIDAGEASDGFHTHNELYAYRRVYNAALFNEWARTGEHEVVKSWKHSDGELAFGGGWFIVVATLPTGQVSNHYQAEYWPLFDVPEVELPPEYDGHTPADALTRLQSFVEADR